MVKVLPKCGIVEDISLCSTRCSSTLSVFYGRSIIVCRSVYPALHEAEECVTLPAQRFFVWLKPFGGIVYDCQHGLGDIFRGTATNGLRERKT